MTKTSYTTPHYYPKYEIWSIENCGTVPLSQPGYNTSLSQSSESVMSSKIAIASAELVSFLFQIFKVRYNVFKSHWRDTVRTWLGLFPPSDQQCVCVCVTPWAPLSVSVTAFSQFFTPSLSLTDWLISQDVMYSIWYEVWRWYEVAKVCLSLGRKMQQSIAPDLLTVHCSPLLIPTFLGNGSHSGSN